MHEITLYPGDSTAMPDGTVVRALPEPKGLRGLLVRLFRRERQPIVIDFDVADVAPARPGSLVILRTGQLLTGDMRRLTREFVVRLREKHPGVGFLVLEPGLEPFVARPGDLITLRYTKRLTPTGRGELSRYLTAIRGRYPRIEFEILDDAWAPVSVLKVERS